VGGGGARIGIERTVPRSRVWMAGVYREIHNMPGANNSCAPLGFNDIGLRMLQRMSAVLTPQQCLGLGAGAPLSLAVRRAHAAASCHLSAAARACSHPARLTLLDAPAPTLMA